MRRLIYLLIFGTLLAFSCKKEPLVEPINNNTNDTTNTYNWYDDYTDGGQTPNNTNTNPIIGTKWVLTKYITGFGTQYPNDTLEFISATKYKINGGIERTYNVAAVTGSTNKTLTLNFFYPFNGSNYSAAVGAYFVQDGFINNAMFTDLQNSSVHITAWFKKI